MKFDWKTIVRSVAPALGTALGGPLGGVATKTIAEKWLGKPDAGEDEIAAAVTNATPEQLAHLRQIDADYKVEMERLGLDKIRAENEDRANARDLYAHDKIPQNILAYLFVTGFFVTLYAVATSESIRTLSDGRFQVFSLLIGILISEIPRIMHFFFGSSTGSKLKTAILGRSKDDA